MCFSIRRFLLFNLLLTLILSSILIGGANYYVDQSHIQRYSNLNFLGPQVALDDFVILVFVVPISGILIWLIVGKGLNSISRVTDELAHRAPHHLEPVNIQPVPEEIQPLVVELNRLFLRLEEAFAREQRFAADAAHELRTPLAALKVGAQVALKADTLQAKDAAIEKLLLTLDRSTHVVQQLLTISKLNPETYGRIEFHPVNLLNVVKEIVGMMVPSADEKRIELSLDYSAKNYILLGDGTSIAMLIRNLVDNAIRYSPPHSSVSIRLLSKKKCFGIEVADHGPGIPEELKQRVFERFYRVVGSKESGSGLGLAIVQQICELHHASLELDAQKEGDGLVIRVWFAPL